MKKIFVVFGMLSAAALWMPSTGFAKLLPLNIPPVLVKKCNNCNACLPSCVNPCVRCTTGCCGTTCKNTSTCKICCNNKCYSTGLCCNNVYYTSGICCNNTYHATGYCCNGTYSATPCPSLFNDTGIAFGANYPTGNNATCTGETISAQDCNTGRDKTVNNSADGIAGFSFTTLTGGCIKDNVTGLTWSPDMGAKTWGGWTIPSTLCGITGGWRVPTVKELLGIVSYHKISPSIDALFTGTASGAYWSINASGSNAWSVSFAYGSTALIPQTPTPYNVRLVNGAATSPNLVDKGNGTIADKTNKLMWKKCLEGFTDIACTSGIATTFTWQTALQRPGTVNGGGGFAGRTDWRLPNIKELQTIVKEDAANPALYTVFPNVPAGGSSVWSSSPYAVATTDSSGTHWKSWAVDFRSGIVGTPLDRTSTLNVRLVRSCTGTECD